MPEDWTLVEARGDLQPGTARVLLEAAERAGLPVTVVRSVYDGFEVPVRLLNYLNESDPSPDEGPAAELSEPEQPDEDLIGDVPTLVGAATSPARSAPGTRKQPVGRRRR